MALIFWGSTCCSICGEILKQEEETIAWSAFLPREHKFWKYSDSGMHKKCFDQWEFSTEFAQLYYKKNEEVDFNNPYVKEMIEKYGIPEWLQKIKDKQDKK